MKPRRAWTVARSLRLRASSRKRLRRYAARLAEFEQRLDAAIALHQELIALHDSPEPSFHGAHFD